MTGNWPPSPSSSPLHIVQMVETLDIGGLERITVDLAIAHRAAGHQSSIYCIFHAGPLAAQAREGGVEVVDFDKPRGFSLKAVRALSRRLRQHSADVVHTHSSGIHHYGVAAAWLAGTPVIVNTRHGLGTLHLPRRQTFYFRATLPFTGAVVCVAEDARRFFIEHRGVPAAKTHVIFNGIPLDRFRQLTAFPGSRRPKFRIGTVGRLVPAKDHAVLIDAFALLAPRLPDVELVIFGGGPLMANLQAQVARLGLEDRVLLPGPSHDVPRHLAGLDLFVLSSISEGLPVVVQEAMAAGLPIVSTRIGGVPEVVPENEAGWFCPPGDAPALAQLLEQTMQRTDLAEVGRRAREIGFARFDIAVTQARYEDLYRRISWRLPPFSCRRTHQRRPCG